MFSEEYVEKLKEENDKNDKDTFSKAGKRNRKDKSTRSFNNTIKEKEEKPGKINPKLSALCSKPHDLNECDEFMKRPLDDRKDFVREKGLCFGCLRPGHISSKCYERLTCKRCEKKHPSVLHDPNWKPKSKGERHRNKREPDKEGIDKTDNNRRDRVNNAFTECSITEAGDVPVNMGIVPIWIYHKSNPDKKIEVYALLDNGSGGTFIKETTLRRLEIDGDDATLVLTTMHGTQEIVTKAVSGLVAVNYQQSNIRLELPRSYVRQQIPADREEIPNPEVTSQFPHLQKVSKQLMPYMEDVEIGLQIGLNCPGALRPREIVH